MKKMHWYLIKAFIGPFFLTFGIAMIVLILQFVWKWIDELVGKGLEFRVIIELLFYTSLGLVPLALILGVLLASIMSFGNLGEHNELTSMKASGISLFNSMKPVLIFVVFLTIAAFSFSNYVIPVTNLKFYTLLLDIRRQAPEFMVKEGKFNNGIDGYSIKVGRRSKDGKTFYDMMIYDQSQKLGNIGVTVADSCYMNVTEDGNYLILSLYSGFSYAEQLEDGRKFDKEKKPLRRDEFSMQQILFALPENELNRSGEDTYKDHYKMMNMGQLADTARAFANEIEWRKKQVVQGLMQREIMRFEDKTKVKTDTLFYPDSLESIEAYSIIKRLDVIDQQNAIKQAQIFARLVQTRVITAKENAESRYQWLNRHWIEWHPKLTVSFACLVFFLIGAPLGAIIRKGGLGTPVVVSIIFFISWHIISLAGEKYARSSILPVWEGMWGSTILLIPLGIFLTFKSTMDSAMMTKETYTIFISKIVEIFKAKHRKANESTSNNQ